MHTPSQVVVVGGGISGLACAYRLRQTGVPVLLLEKSDRVGGVIQSVEQDGFLFELGPQSFSATDAILEIIQNVSLEDQLLRADARAPRYVLVNGRLHPVPMNPPALLTTRLLSSSTKWRFLAEPLRRSKPPEEDESVADFVRRKFGAELLELLVGPFISGIYAGDPEKLSLRSAFPSAYQWEKKIGSVIRGAMKSRPSGHQNRHTLSSFKGGMATLPRRLGGYLAESVRCGVSVEAVSHERIHGGSRFHLQIAQGGRTEVLTANFVVVATDTPAVGRFLAGVSARFAQQLAKIEYAPLVVVGAGYRREQIAHSLNGFGFLVPRKEGLRTLGCVWNSSLFPLRAPHGMVNLTCFAGGAMDPGLLQMSDSQIADTIERELASVLKVSGLPVVRHVQRHARALPQYNLGHGNIIAALRELCASAPGLFLAGNYLAGPSIGACVEHAFCIAHSVQHYFSSTGELKGAAVVSSNRDAT